VWNSKFFLRRYFFWREAWNLLIYAGSINTYMFQTQIFLSEAETSDHSLDMTFIVPNIFRIFLTAVEAACGTMWQKLVRLVQHNSQVFHIGHIAASTAVRKNLKILGQ